MNDLSDNGSYQRSQANLFSPQGGYEGVAPSGFAGGGGNASPGNGETPPDTCPICKAKKERFERFI